MGVCASKGAAAVDPAEGTQPATPASPAHAPSFRKEFSQKLALQRMNNPAPGLQIPYYMPAGTPCAATCPATPVAAKTAAIPRSRTFEFEMHQHLLFPVRMVVVLDALPSLEEGREEDMQKKEGEKGSLRAIAPTVRRTREFLIFPSCPRGPFGSYEPGLIQLEAVNIVSLQISLSWQRVHVSSALLQELAAQQGLALAAEHPHASRMPSEILRFVVSLRRNNVDIFNQDVDLENMEYFECELLPKAQPQPEMQMYLETALDVESLMGSDGDESSVGTCSHLATPLMPLLFHSRRHAGNDRDEVDEGCVPPVSRLNENMLLHDGTESEVSACMTWTDRRARSASSSA